METLKEAFVKTRRELILAAVALILLGALFVAYPESSGLAICYVVAGILCIFGLLRVIFYFLADRTEVFGSFGLVQGALLVALSVLIFARPAFLAGVLTTAFGIVVILDGIMKLQYSIDLLRLKAPLWWLVMALGVVMAILGVVAVCNPFETAAALMIFLGVSLIADGISDLASIFYVLSVVRKTKKLVSEGIRDVKEEAAAVETEFRDAADAGEAPAEPADGGDAPSPSADGEGSAPTGGAQ